MIESSIINRIKEFSNPCFQCGACSGVCPIARLKDFSPRKIIYASHLGLVESLLEPNGRYIWSCSTCGACLEKCPKEIQLVDVMRNVRQIGIEKGDVPTNLIKPLENMFKMGNPLGMPASRRVDWVKEVNGEVKVLDKKSDLTKEKATVLYFVGCYPSYDTRCQEVAIATVETLLHANTDFFILGENEKCCGSEARRMGEMGLFEHLSGENTKLFNTLKIDQIVTTSPHCYHTIKNEYPEGDYEVQHYTQYVWNLIKTGKIKFSKKMHLKVTFHDPCYLGRHNKIYDAPRNALMSIPGIRLVEMPRNREKSFCCGGGGGGIWLDDKFPGERPSEIRIKEALSRNVDLLVTACPFDLINFEDAVKTTDSEEKIRVMDFIEIVKEALRID